MIEKLTLIKNSLVTAISNECALNCHNCTSCRYAGRCKLEVESIEAKIQAIYCKKSNSCLSCNYLAECSHPKANQARAASRKLLRANR